MKERRVTEARGRVRANAWLMAAGCTWCKKLFGWCPTWRIEFTTKRHRTIVEFIEPVVKLLNSSTWNHFKFVVTNVLILRSTLWVTIQCRVATFLGIMIPIWKKKQISVSWITNFQFNSSNWRLINTNCIRRFQRFAFDTMQHVCRTLRGKS